MQETTERFSDHFPSLLLGRERYRFWLQRNGIKLGIEKGRYCGGRRENYRGSIFTPPLTHLLLHRCMWKLYRAPPLVLWFKMFYLYCSGGDVLLRVIYIGLTHKYMVID